MTDYIFMIFIHDLFRENLLKMPLQLKMMFLKQKKLVLQKKMLLVLQMLHLMMVHFFDQVIINNADQLDVVVTNVVSQPSNASQ